MEGGRDWNCSEIESAVSLVGTLRRQGKTKDKFKVSLQAALQCLYTLINTS